MLIVNTDKIEQALLKMLELGPNKPKSVSSKLEEHKKLITKLVAYGYSYKQISTFLGEQGIKASATVIAAAVKNTRSATNKAHKIVAQSEAGDNDAPAA
jgi:hypothetical protein